MDINMVNEFYYIQMLLHTLYPSYNYTMHKMENTYYLYDIPLLSSDHFKYLGVTLQSNLRYDRQVQDITAKSNHTLGLL